MRVPRESLVPLMGTGLQHQLRCGKHQLLKKCYADLGLLARESWQQQEWAE